jgi:ABC-type nitrate/sulfonate/bicarbonate transport system substrate-binding protein
MLDRWVLSVVFAIPLLAACGSSATTSETIGGGPVVDTVYMSPTAQPTYGWQKGNADTVDVVRLAAPGTIVWRTVADSMDGIPSGLTHGTAGAGRTVTVDIEPVLTVGIAYRVRIERQSGTTVITKDFTVQP